MTEKAIKKRASGKGDRRFLKRADSGRRSEEIEETTFLGTGEDEVGPRYTPGSYLFLMFATFIIGVVTVRALNTELAPMLYGRNHIIATAPEMHGTVNYATYDLNIETRLLRREHMRSLDEAPEITVMGASHWQEAHNALMPDARYYNAHIHRDYYEDIVTVVYWMVKYERLPEKLVLSIRDSQFMAPEDRTDFLWVPILDDYRAEAAPYFELTPHRVFENGLTPQLRQVLSLEILMDNIHRYLRADELPHLTQEIVHPTLDILRHDGSIYWSEKHREGFTAERTLRESKLLADGKRYNPPQIDPYAVEAIDRVLGYLHRRGVEVYLAHPPFNPQVWDDLEDTPYMEGLADIKALVAGYAEKYGFDVIGSFNPHDLGCTAEMYIDGEHSSPECLGRILLQTL